VDSAVSPVKDVAVNHSGGRGVAWQTRRYYYLQMFMYQTVACRPHHRLHRGILRGINEQLFGRLAVGSSLAAVVACA